MINKITQTKTQSVKTGTIVIKGIDQNHTNLQLRREDSPKNFGKILDTLNQLRTHDDTVNILVIGKVGQGKSTYINYTQHILQKSFNYLIDKHAPNAECYQTVTKSFKLYPRMCHSSNSRINFIDGPGIGPPNSKMNMTFKQYNYTYLKAFDTLLKGRLDYSAFEIPDKIDVKSATTASPDYDKIIHYCLVFVDINDNGQADFVKDCCKCLNQNYVRYGIVLNKADLHIETRDVNTRFPVSIQQFKQTVRGCNYKVNADYLFITSLKLQLFADNNEIFHEYTRSFEYALESSLQYSRTNIIKIYLKKISNEKFIGSIHRNIASSLTLQDYIKENRENIHLKDLDYQKNLLIRTQHKIVPVSVKEFLYTPLQELVIHSKEQFTIHLSIRK